MRDDDEDARQMKVLLINLKATCAHSDLSEALIARVLRDLANEIDPHSVQ